MSSILAWLLCNIIGVLLAFLIICSTEKWSFLEFIGVKKSKFWWDKIK